MPVRVPRRPYGLSAWGTSLLACLVPARASWAQTLGQGSDDGISLWRVLAALLLCLVLAVVGGFALKKRLDGSTPTLATLFKRGPTTRRRLKLVESLRIGTQVELCIVTCDGREFLVATSTQGVQLLQRLPSDAGVAPDGDPPQ